MWGWKDDNREKDREGCRYEGRERERDVDMKGEIEREGCRYEGRERGM